jgi:putative ABC transport system permease protein
VMFIVVRRACVLVSAGLIVGAPVAMWTTQAAAGLVGNVPAGSPVPLVIAGVATIGAAIAAAAIPARRATRVDPIVALRCE